MVIFSTVRANGAVYPPLLILVCSMFVGRIGFAWWMLSRTARRHQRSRRKDGPMR